MAEFSELLGKTLEKAENQSNERIIFTTNTGEEYTLYHKEDCCETVRVEDVIGDLSDLVGAPILMAEEVGSDDPPLRESDESYTWTFYKLATIKGYVTIRWYGESNGQYSESVSFEKSN